jgi:hypothetical protein
MRPAVAEYGLDKGFKGGKGSTFFSGDFFGKKREKLVFRGADAVFAQILHN